MLKGMKTWIKTCGMMKKMEDDKVDMEESEEKGKTKEEDDENLVGNEDQKEKGNNEKRERKDETQEEPEFDILKIKRCLNLKTLICQKTCSWMSQTQSTILKNSPKI